MYLVGINAVLDLNLSFKIHTFRDFSKNTLTFPCKFFSCIRLENTKRGNITSKQRHYITEAEYVKVQNFRYFASLRRNAQETQHNTMWCKRIDNKNKKILNCTF